MNGLQFYWTFNQLTNFDPQKLYNQTDTNDWLCNLIFFYFRIHPYHYIHVLDQTSNVTRVEIGPQTFIRKDNEKVILAPTKMVIVPPGNYCCVTNPAKKDKNGEPVKDTLNQVCNICIFYTMAIPVMEFQLQTLVSFI